MRALGAGNIAWVLLLLIGFFPGSLLAQPDPPAPTFANVTVHDPSVMRAGNVFYVYGSHLASASTPDFLNWTQISTSATAGNTLVPNPAVTFSEVLSWAQTNTFWAPDCIRLPDGRYYLYYCACRGDAPISALGLAVADAPTGPFSHVAVLLRSGMNGASEDGTNYNAAIHPNVVDPSVFFDHAGKYWMVYGSYSGGIFILEMDPATGRQKPGQGYGKKLIGRDHSRIEGAYIIYSPESEYYYLFLSFGGLDANGGYNIRVARSRSPDGPYVDAAGTDLTTVGGANGTFFDDAAIAPHGVKLMGNYQFLTVAGETGTSRGYVSPGHNSVYYDAAADKYFLVFHTRFVGLGEQHQARVHPMFINADDWFVVAPHRYARETISATDLGRVVGNYKLINHGRDITAAVKPSSTISLLPDSTITGAAAGTWQLSGDYDATLVLGGVTYRGVFLRQWDDDRQRWMPAFTALSSSGVAVWGTKVAIDVTPVVLAQPSSQTVIAGADVTLSAVASGEPVPAFQWRRNGADIAGATGRTLALSKVSAADAASYAVVITNRAGAVTSAAATLTVNTPPTISAHPLSVTQPAGSSVSLAVSANGSGTLTYQWLKNGVAISGAIQSALSFTSLQPVDAGDYAVRVSDTVATTTSRFSRVVVAAPEPGRIVNMSVRSAAGINGQPLIVGFGVAGGSKQLLVRSIGPRLASFSVTGVMADPAMEVHAWVNNVDTITGTNNDWGANGQAATMSAAFAQVSAFALSDTASKDAALLANVDGTRTVHVNSAGAAQRGVVLMEVYDMDPDATPRLINVSARNFAGRDAETLIAGFFINGNSPKRVLVRGVGPTLQDFNVPGVLADPRLEVHTMINDVDVVVASNDDWSGEPGVAAAGGVASAFPLRDASTDAALVLTLPAGGYTALVFGTGATTGEALVEVYELP